MEATDQDNPSEKETSREEYKFSAIHLIQTSDPVKYRNINKELHNGSYLISDESPTNS